MHGYAKQFLFQLQYRRACDGKLNAIIMEMELLYMYFISVGASFMIGLKQKNFYTRESDL